MRKIVSGFSNIGKSTLSNYKDIHYIDFDTCYFKKLIIGLIFILIAY